MMGGVEQYKARRKKRLDSKRLDEDKWITAHPNGAESKGVRILIDENGNPQQGWAKNKGLNFSNAKSKPLSQLKSEEKKKPSLSSNQSKPSGSGGNPSSGVGSSSTQVNPVNNQNGGYDLSKYTETIDVSSYYKDDAEEQIRSHLKSVPVGNSIRFTVKTSIGFKRDVVVSKKSGGSPNSYVYNTTIGGKKYYNLSEPEVAKLLTEQYEKEKPAKKRQINLSGLNYGTRKKVMHKALTSLEPNETIDLGFTDRHVSIRGTGTPEYGVYINGGTPMYMTEDKIMEKFYGDIKDYKFEPEDALHQFFGVEGGQNTYEESLDWASDMLDDFQKKKTEWESEEWKKIFDDEGVPEEERGTFELSYDTGHGGKDVYYIMRPIGDDKFEINGRKEYYEGSYDLVKEALPKRIVTKQELAEILAKRRKRFGFSRLHGKTISDYLPPWWSNGDPDKKKWGNTYPNK